jgi:transcriptional regulator with XRE-family HTH domain
MYGIFTIMTNMQKIKTGLGKRLNQARKKIGLNQGEFGEHLGCGRSNISQIENGLFFPTSSLLTALKSKFNVSLDWLFSGEGSMFIEEKEKNLDLLDFKEYSNDIKTMLQEMKNSKFIMHRVLAEFFEIKLDKNPFILEVKKKKKKKKNKEKR